MTPGPKGTSTLATMHLQTILVTFVLWLDASIYIDKIMVFGPQPLGTSILLAAVTSILWTLDTPGAAIRRANHQHFHRFFPQYTSNYWEELWAIYGQYIYIYIYRTYCTCHFTAGFVLGKPTFKIWLVNLCWRHTGRFSGSKPQADSCI